MNAIIEQARMDYLRRIRFYMAKFMRDDNCTPEQARQWAVSVIEAEDADDYRREWKGPDDRAECIPWV